MKKLAMTFLFSSYSIMILILIASALLYWAPKDWYSGQKTVIESEFRKYPIEKFIDYRLNTPYWSLPKVQDEKHALKTEIEKLYFTVIAFNEKKLTPKQAYDEIVFHETWLAGYMKMAFQKHMPDGIASVFENTNYGPGTNNSKAIYKYRLPTIEETKNEKLWGKWVLNKNLYTSSVWIINNVFEQAYINAIFESKKLGVPNSYIAFDLALNGELERMSELMQKH